MNTDERLTTAEAAAYLRRKPGTLEIWRCTKRGGPRWIKVGRSVLYRRSDLDRFLDENTHDPNEKAPA